MPGEDQSSAHPHLRPGLPAAGAEGHPWPALTRPTTLPTLTGGRGARWPAAHAAAGEAQPQQEPPLEYLRPPAPTLTGHRLRRGGRKGPKAPEGPPGPARSQALKAAGAARQPRETANG